MDRTKNLKNPRIYIAFTITLVIALAVFPHEGRFKYKYQKGRPWMYETLITPIDFPLLKTEAELLSEREEQASKIVPYYNYDEAITVSKLKLVSILQADDAFNTESLSNWGATVKKYYDRGILSLVYDEDFSDKVIVVQRDKRATTIPATEVYDIQKVKRLLFLEFGEIPGVNIDELIVPNLVLDRKKTELLQREAVKYISPTKGIVYTGQLIVAEGEIVTSEIEQMLDSYKAEYEVSFGYSGSYFGLLTGQAIIIMVILALLFVIIYFVDIKIFNNKRSYYFLLTLFILFFCLIVFVRNVETSYLYCVPCAVFALYLVSFFNQSFSFPVYALILLPLLLISQLGVELYVMNLFAGAIAMVSHYYLNRGWLQFLNSFFIFIGITIVYVAFRLITDGLLQTFDSRILLYLSLNAFFVIGAYPLVFLFEKIFSLVSNSRLRDLSDTSNKLLLEMSKKAPGSFQHSLQVANMADAAAREIGGDTMLIRVGALYHDIGKILNPQCFIENQPAGIDFHSRYTPLESAQKIISHVDDGVELAKKNNLPPVVIDFIKTHHARSLTAFFYNSYCKQGGDPENKEPFTYHGDLPRTKEHVIVMMADAVEAASRTLKDYTGESISNLVENLVAARISDAQLVEADISIREINLIKDVFKKHLKQFYHERIVYPEFPKPTL